MTELETELLRAVPGSILLVYTETRAGNMAHYTFVKVGGSWVWRPGDTNFQVFPDATLRDYYEHWQWVVM